MMIRRITILCALLIAAALFSGCASHKKAAVARARQTNPVAVELIDRTRDTALAAMKENHRGQAATIAQQGVAFADRCVEAAPDEAGCYYWRAVATGLYHKNHVIGYQRGVKKMIDDCKKVIELDPGYDNAGAYRILGQLYTQLPQTAVRPDSITRDLALAEGYLRKSVELAPDYPENHLSLAETLLAEEKNEESLTALAQAKTLACRWKNDVSYNDWGIAMKTIEKKLVKCTR